MSQGPASSSEAALALRHSRNVLPAPSSGHSRPLGSGAGRRYSPVPDSLTLSPRIRTHAGMVRSAQHPSIPRPSLGRPSRMHRHGRTLRTMGRGGLRDTMAPHGSAAVYAAGRCLGSGRIAARTSHTQYIARRPSTPFLTAPKNWPQKSYGGNFYPLAGSQLPVGLREGGQITRVNDDLLIHSYPTRLSGAWQGSVGCFCLRSPVIMLFAERRIRTGGLRQNVIELRKMHVTSGRYKNLLIALGSHVQPWLPH